MFNQLPQKFKDSLSQLQTLKFPSYSKSFTKHHPTLLLPPLIEQHYEK